MSLNHEVCEAIRKFCHETSGRQPDIHLDTEIVFDAWIYGDDLDNLFCLLEEKFGADLSDLSTSAYGPNEVFGHWVSLFQRWFDPRKRYKSLTVQALADMVVERLKESG